VAAVLATLLSGRVDAVPSTRGIEPGVRAVLELALSTDQYQRYPDAEQFLAALEQAAQRSYGAQWWTQAGLGAAAVGAAAALVPIGAAAAGAGAAVGGAGAVAATGGSGGAGATSIVARQVG